jgi:hypothetical protein
MPKRILVDSNVLLDVLTDDPQWGDWSCDALAAGAEYSALVIDPVIYAEVSVRYEGIEDLDLALSPDAFLREAIPWEAAFLAAKCFVRYRQAGGARRSTLPDFFIGAHAAIADMVLLTRDAGRYTTYFPTVELLSPGD